MIATIDIRTSPKKLGRKPQAKSMPLRNAILAIAAEYERMTGRPTQPRPVFTDSELSTVISGFTLCGTLCSDRQPLVGGRMDTKSPPQTFVGPVYGAVAAARRVAISPSYLHRLVRHGVVSPSIPAADGRRLFSQADVDALAAHLGRSTDRASTAEAA